jgi:ribonuclease P protein component
MVPQRQAGSLVTPSPAGPTTGQAEGYSFTLADRVRRRQEYQAVYEHGTRLSGSLMTVFFHRNTLGRSRLGIAATRKMGPAVVRNRAKRRVRDVFRRHRLAEAIDIVVIPRRNLATADFVRVESEYCGILKRHERMSRA